MEYLKLLLKQYEERGESKLDLEKLKKEIEIYKKSLKEDGILDNICLELGKGNLHSVSDTDSRITLLTSFKNTFPNDKARVILDGEILKNPHGITIKENNSHEDITMQPNNQQYCIAHNPFDYEKTCSDLQVLHNQGFNVILGMFGNFSDKNYQEKLLFPKIKKELR